MNTQLILLIDEQWPHEAAADWVLLDDGGTLLEQGRSTPAHWPEATSHHALLSASQSLWCEVDLPPAPRRERPRLISYALEEHLIGDTDEQHFTVTHSRTGKEFIHTGVLATSRTRLKQLQAQFEQLGRPLHSLRSALEMAPSATDHWVLSLRPGHEAMLTTGAGPATAFDLDTPAALGELLTTILLLRSRDEHGDAGPVRLELRVADGHPPIDLSGLQVDGLTLATGADWQWWADYRRASEQLHGEFAPQHASGGHWRRYRLPLAVAAVALLGLCTANLVELLLNRQALARIESQGARIFAGALPGTPAIAPAAQLSRALDIERSTHRQLVASDLLSLLHAHLQATPRMPLKLDYETGQLRLTVAADEGAGSPLPAAQFSLQGIDARIDGQDWILTPSARH